jgi:pimeloyl-ACP methyl ester carboxylesterase
MIQTVREQPLTIGDALHRLQAEAEHRTFAGPRYKCQYASWGNGPALIFIHGLADSIPSFAMPMSFLCHEFRCISYNQPNGRSDGARLWGYGADMLVEDLCSLMDHLEISQAYLVGHSFGSTIATRALHARPDRFPRAILLCGFAERRLTMRELLLCWLFRLSPGTLQGLPFRQKFFEECHHCCFDGLEPERWPTFLDITGRPPISALSHWAQQLHRTNTTALLPAIRQPILVACGDRDPLVPHSQQEMLFNKLPNATMFQIAGCGHFPNFTHPEALADAARRFLLVPSCAFHQEGKIAG